METAIPRRGAPTAPEADPLALKRSVAELHLEGAALVLPAEAEATKRQWLSRRPPDLGGEAGTKAAAPALAMELESFTPPMSGTTAVDRLARQRDFDADHAAAHRVLETARFSISRARAPLGRDLYAAEDLASGDLFTYVGEAFGLVLPFDDAGLAVTMDFVKPGRGLPHGHRCAAAVYRHLVRHGGPVIAGLNEPDELIGELGEEDREVIASPLDPIASGLVADGRWREPPPSVLAEVRRNAGADATAVCQFKSVDSDRQGRSALGLVYRRFVEVGVEALHLRALAGSGPERDPLGSLSALLDREVATNGYPRCARDGQPFHRAAALHARRHLRDPPRLADGRRRRLDRPRSFDPGGDRAAAGAGRGGLTRAA